MGRRKVRATSTICYIVKDGEEQTLEVGIVGSEDAAWKCAQGLLQEKNEAKRVIFFDRDFAFVNALNKPKYLRREVDVVAEEDRQELQRMLQEFESGSTLEGRAITPGEKRAFLHRLYEVWTQKDNDQLRFGQMLAVCFHDRDIFVIEDEAFIQALEVWKE